MYGTSIWYVPLLPLKCFVNDSLNFFEDYTSNEGSDVELSVHEEEQEDPMITLYAAVTHADMLQKFSQQTDWDLLPTIEVIFEKLRLNKFNGITKKQTVFDFFSKIN